MTPQRLHAVVSAYHCARECVHGMQTLVVVAAAARCVAAVDLARMRRVTGLRVVPGTPVRPRLSRMSEGDARKALDSSVRNVARDLVLGYGKVVVAHRLVRQLPAGMFDDAADAHAGDTTFNYWRIAATSALAAVRDLSWEVLAQAHAPDLLELADPHRTPEFTKDMTSRVTAAVLSEQFGGVDARLRDLDLPESDLRRVGAALAKEERLLTHRGPVQVPYAVTAIDREKLTVTVDGAPVAVTKAQLKVLDMLLDARGGWVALNPKGRSTGLDKIVRTIPTVIKRFIVSQRGHGGGSRVLVEHFDPVVFHRK